MADLHKDAEAKLLAILSYFLSLPFYGYGMRPIGWWYYKVKFEINELDHNTSKVGYGLRYKLKKVNGIAIYDRIKINDGSFYVIVKDFIFNLSKIKTELCKPIVNGEEYKSPHDKYISVFMTPSSELIDDKIIGLKIEMCTYADGTIILKRKGRNIPLIHQFDKIESFFKKRKDGKTYAIGLKNNKRYKIYITDFYHDDIEEINESYNKMNDKLLIEYYNVLYTLIYN